MPKQKRVKVTQADRLRFQIDAVQAQIMLLLGWNEEAMSEFIENSALDFIAIYLKHNEEAVTAVYSTDTFHGWWKLRWHDRNVAFLDGHKVLKLINTHVLRWRYRRLNDGARLAAGKSLFAKLLDESYCRDLVPLLR
jgi:hypothetical protein